MSSHPHESPEPLRTVRQVLGGIGWGLAFATGFSLIVAVLAVLRGSTEYTEYRTNTGQVVLAYYAAGVLGGTVFGLLHRVRGTVAGAVLTGAVIGTCVYGAVGLAINGWATFQPWGALILGVPLGGIMGYKWRDGIR